MKGLVTIIICLLVATSILNAQTPPEISWSKTFTGPLAGTGLDWGYSAQQTSDGGYILTARKDHGSFDLNGWLIKTNQFGDTLWTKEYGDTYIDETYMVKEVSDGGYILCGVSTAFGNAGEAWLLRTDANGNTIWSNGYHSALSGATSWDYFYDIYEKPDGSFITIGFSYVEGKEWQAWISNIGSNGVVIWSKIFGGDYWDRLYSIQPTDDGGFMAVGDTHVEHSDTVSHDGWLVKYDSNGDTLWTKIFGGAQVDMFKFINKTSDGGFIITGEREPVWSGGFFGWIVKVDASGNLIWNNMYQRGGLYGAQECSDGYIAGGIYAPQGGSLQGSVVKTGFDGTLLWNKLIEATDNDEAITSLNKTSDGGFILAGRTNAHMNQGSAWLIKLDPEQPEIPVSFTQNFDGVTPPALPEGWTGLRKVLISNQVAEIKTFEHGGTISLPNAIFLMNGLNGGNGQLDSNAFVALVSPLVDISSDGGIFTFYGNGTNPVKVGTLTDPADTSTFELIQEIALTSSFVQYSVTIPGPGQKYIAVKHGNTNNVTPLFLDDFAFTPIVPVELSSFYASVDMNNDVVLNWSTATETNNAGFEIQRSRDNEDFISVGYVKGFGTTTEIQKYSFTDNNVEYGNYAYRLKQIDNDGSYNYSGIENVTVNNPESYLLAQNYPNPFNPSTSISYRIPEDGFVTLKIYDMLGTEIATLVNEKQTRGNYKVSFDAGNLSSGIYIYQIKANNFISNRKMTLIK